MAYAIYTNHPETWDRREADFTSWRFWSRKNAPWVGVGIDEMARIVVEVCQLANQGAALCDALDNGGDIDAEGVSVLLRVAGHRMEAETREVLSKAASGGYGVRVVFSQALGSAVTASAYAAKFGSELEH